jgi:hypothetical protein
MVENALISANERRPKSEQDHLLRRESLIFFGLSE